MTLFYRFKISIRFVGIKDLVAVHHRDEVFGLREVDNIMGVSRKHVDGGYVVAGDFPFEDLAFWIIKVALLDESMAFDHDELLELGVVPMLPLGDSGFGDVDADLAGIVRVDQLGE